MSVNYVPIIWNRQKKIYDRILIGFILLYLVIFSGLQFWLNPEISPETLIIRATATLAFLLLHIILLIGPLARLDKRFLPVLYNRRHLGVTMFLIALIHGLFSIIQFHTLGNVNPIVSLFTSNPDYNSWTHFPFQPLGFFALLILFLMAATSHDFWLKNLSPKVWKSLHMMVYIAYGLVVLHVLMGILQQETEPTLAIVVAIGLAMVAGAHLAAGIKENSTKNKVEDKAENSLVPVLSIDEILDNRAKIVRVKDQEIAIFKYENKLSAVHNICKHQNGPLGEGKIVDGCITCPWHGYQYYPGNGQSPPPFTEKVATYQLALKNGTIYVNPEPLPEGTPVDPVIIETSKVS